MAGFDSAYADWTPPLFSPASIPALPNLTLNDSERELIGYLQTKCVSDRPNMVTTNAYYMGAQAIDNLEIAIPKELAEKLRTIVGWAEIAVDPFVDRLHVEGFRLPGETDVNADMASVWTLNGLDAEESLAYTDALSMSRAYWLLGSDPDIGVRITVESPLNMAVQWDVTGRRAVAALQSYRYEDEQRAALYLPNRTVHVAMNTKREWVLVDVDQHNFGHVPLVRMANRVRTDNRNGRSEIRPGLMSVIDSACRRLMGLEASSELYSLPRILFMGASAEDFQNADGQMRKAWDAYITKINMLERDEEGNLPEVVQLTSYDPSVFTKVIEMYASQAAGQLLALPQDLGLYTDGNPPSVEALEAMESRRNRHARSMQRAFSVPHIEVQQMAQRFLNGGRLPDEYRHIEVDWAPPETVSLTAAADAVYKLTSGDNPVLPAQSDVVLKRLGFSAVERAQIEQDRGEQVQTSITDALRQAAANARQPQQVNGGDTGSTT